MQIFAYVCIYTRLYMCVYVQFPPPLELGFKPRHTASRATEELGAEETLLTTNTQFSSIKVPMHKDSRGLGDQETQDEVLSLN